MYRRVAQVVLLLSCVYGLHAHSAGTILVRISSFLNPEGRDAAGACCQRDLVELTSVKSKENKPKETEKEKDGTRDAKESKESKDKNAAEKDEKVTDSQSKGETDRGGRSDVCSTPCFTMLKVCASRVENESVVVIHGGDKGYQYQTRRDLAKPDVEPELVIGEGRVPYQPPPIRPPLRYSPKPPPPPTSSQRRPARPPPSRNPPIPRPQGYSRPVNYQPNKAAPRPLSRPPRPLPPSRPVRPDAVRPPSRISGRPDVQSRPESRISSPFDFKFWRRQPPQQQFHHRQDRSLLTPTDDCSFGTIQTDVLFNNSLQGDGSLLIRIPFQADFEGVVKLSIEAWHIDNPRRIPQPPKESKQRKKTTSSTSFLERFISSLTDQIKNNIQKVADEDISDEIAKDLNVEKDDDIDDADDADNDNDDLADNDDKEPKKNSTVNSTISEDIDNANVTRADKESNKDGTTTNTTLEATTEPVQPTEKSGETDNDSDNDDDDDNDDDTQEKEKVLDDPSKPLRERGRLILRLERNHLLLAGGREISNSFTAYNARIDYSVKLACAHNYTGETCSFAKICLNKNMKNNRRMYCTGEGEVKCREGWQGDLCQEPICAPGCHTSNGYCKKPGECLCRTGYSGKQCTNCVRLPGCQHGTCTKGYECKCTEGYIGLFCNKPICSDGCHPENGYCKKAGTCECRRGWQGTNCTECSTKPGCAHGTCNEPLQCNCDEQYTGEFCSEPRCTADCSTENGYCTKPEECICRLGWQGAHCKECVQYPGCLNGDCEGPWDCICHKGWKGQKCDQIDSAAFALEDQNLPSLVAEEDIVTQALDQNETDIVILGVKDIKVESIEARNKNKVNDKQNEEKKKYVIEGRCNLKLSFRCMNGGMDVCRFGPDGSRIGDPECRCKSGYSGRFCQHFTTEFIEA